MTTAVQIRTRSHFYSAAGRAFATVSILLVSSLTAYPQASEQSKSFSTVLRRRETLHYVVSLPRQYAQISQRWPVILYLHGAGDRGNNLDFVKRQGPPYVAEHQPDFPFIVVSPQLPATEDVWAAYDVALIRLMENVLRHYRADRSRIYLTGISMGGMGTWQLAKENPDYFAAIAPLAGWTDLEWATILTRTPIWVFHGARDDVVPLSMSEKMVEALRAAGGNPKFAILTDMDHGIGPTVWNRQDLYDWMLQHRLPAK
jgi:predicted peptidase